MELHGDRCEAADEGRVRRIDLLMDIMEMNSRNWDESAKTQRACQIVNTKLNTPKVNDTGYVQDTATQNQENSRPFAESCLEARDHFHRI
jgi:hypothetical protein